MRNGIAAVLIVRNEEKVLARCLESLAGVDQIVVLDTGSDDKTMEIARSFEADVQAIPPIVPFHFAEARNKALEFARQDWIISIDADEVLAKGALDLIRKATWREPQAAGFNVNFILFDEEGKNPTRLPKFKMFRRTLWKWQYRVHEQLQPLSAGLVIKNVLAAAIEHRPVPKTGVRVGQNEELLKIAVDENPEYARNVRQLGMELYSRQKWAEAIPHLEKYLASNQGDRLDRSETMMRLAYCKGSIEKYHESIEIFEEAQKIAPERREILYYKGVIFAKGRSVEQAVEAFEQCLAIPASSKPDWYLNVEAVWDGSAVLPELEEANRLVVEGKRLWAEQQARKGKS